MEPLKETENKIEVTPIEVQGSLRELAASRVNYFNNELPTTSISFQKNGKVILISLLK